MNMRLDDAEEDNYADDAMIMHRIAFWELMIQEF